MAPEQLRVVVDMRCDIYSIGRTLYELASMPGGDGGLDPSLPEELSKIVLKACKPRLKDAIKQRRN